MLRQSPLGPPDGRPPPLPGSGPLLATSDEAGYDLAPRDIAEALASPAPCLHHDAPRAAHLALRAAHAAYESRFGHAFVICLDAFHPSSTVDQVLAGIRAGWRTTRTRSGR